MKRRFLFTVMAVVLTLVAGGTLAYAQTANVDITFAFTAGGKQFPAGKYTIEATGGGPLVLRSVSSTTVSVLMPSITRLGRHDTDTDPELVFDKLPDGLYLSEVWFPGRDGYLLLGTKEQHEHRILGGPMGKK